MAPIFWISVAFSGLSFLVLGLAYGKFKLAKLDMSFVEFARRLLKGGGYKNLSFQAFEDLQTHDNLNGYLIDLRSKDKVASDGLPNAISSPFNDFLKEVVVEGKYNPSDPIILVCDTGHMSRVAANILVEDEGFAEVYNLPRGIEKWKQWREKPNRSFSCCPGMLGQKT